MRPSADQDSEFSRGKKGLYQEVRSEIADGRWTIAPGCCPGTDGAFVEIQIVNQQFKKMVNRNAVSHEATEAPDEPKPMVTNGR